MSDHPLHARRQRIAKNAEDHEKNRFIWTDAFDDGSRVRIAAMWNLKMGQSYDVDIRRYIELEIGMPASKWKNKSIGAYLTDLADDEFIPTILEAMCLAFQDHSVPEFVAFVNTVMAEHRISYEIIDRQMVPFDDSVLHANVVKPALALLGGKQGWESVEVAFRDALGEIAVDPGDAITDAGTALQEALKVRGCKGNALGPLLHDAVTKGILAPHDITLGTALQKLGDWVSADRSNMGESHKVSVATRDDAWLTLHVVGALIVRLSKEDRRG